MIRRRRLHASMRAGRMQRPIFFKHRAAVAAAAGPPSCFFTDLLQLKLKKESEEESPSPNHHHHQIAAFLQAPPRAAAGEGWPAGGAAAGQRSPSTKSVAVGQAPMDFSGGAERAGDPSLCPCHARNCESRIIPISSYQRKQV